MWFDIHHVPLSPSGSLGPRALATSSTSLETSRKFGTRSRGGSYRCREDGVRPHVVGVSYPFFFHPLLGSESPRMSPLVSNIHVRKCPPHLDCMAYNHIFVNVTPRGRIVTLSTLKVLIYRTRAYSSIGHLYPVMLISRSDGYRLFFKARNNAGKNPFKSDMDTLSLGRATIVIRITNGIQ